MHIGGHVRGNINGYIDADIRGLFYGDLNALVETKSVSSAAVSDISEPEGFLSADSSDTDEVNPL